MGDKIKLISNKNVVILLSNENNNCLFNEEVKNSFLKDMVQSGSISEETSKSYARILEKTSYYEEKTNKDLNKFTLEELETILFDFQANNRNTIESYARIISSYFNWSVNKGLSQSNPLADIKPDDFSKYLTNEERYFTDTELRLYEANCVNFQDAVIMRLLFMGVGGKQFSEIRNLKKNDIDRDNMCLKLINTLKADDHGFPVKYTERWINIDNRTLQLIDGALKQKIYTKKNGEMETERNNIRPFTNLVNNDYVIRTSITNTENWHAPVDKYVIYRRIKTISESLGIDLTAKFIQRSGMIYHANHLIQDNELSLDDIKIIADRFNITSYHNLKGFLTVENIRKTYPLRE